MCCFKATYKLNFKTKYKTGVLVSIVIFCIDRTPNKLGRYFKLKYLTAL